MVSPNSDYEQVAATQHTVIQHTTSPAAIIITIHVSSSNLITITRTHHQQNQWQHTSTAP
jgi:hypothetical protein